MTHDQCFVFMKTLKKTRKKRKHSFGLATTNAFCLCVHQTKTNKLSISVHFWPAVYALAVHTVDYK